MKLNLKKIISYLIYIFIILIGIILVYLVINGETTTIFVSSLLITLIIMIIIYFIVQRKELEKSFRNISYRVNGITQDKLNNFPIGVIMYDNFYNIVWTNPYIKSIFKESIEELSLEEFNKEIYDKILIDKPFIINLDIRTFQIIPDSDKQVIYFFDNTEMTSLGKKYYNESNVFAVINVDNFSEVIQNLDEQNKAEINGQISHMIANYAAEFNFYIKKYSNSQYLAVLNEQILKELEEDNFKVLDKTREVGENLNYNITISIGIAKGEKNIIELGDLAYAALDLALSRGGDQVAIKSANGDTNFYGGKTDAVEKRNRVRARVISQTIADLMNESEKVLIMGHKNSDHDSIGSSIGMFRLAKSLEKDCYIILENRHEKSVSKFVHELKENVEDLEIISVDDAKEIITKETLLVVVDNHKINTVISDELLQLSTSTIIIDHHRRGDNFIESSILTYIEPYASSTSELVVELMDYFPLTTNLTAVEATMLLSGIIVDTKHFTYRTGSRTFDAAAKLKVRGADTILIQELLKEDLNDYLESASLINSAEMIGNGITILRADEDVIYDKVAIAKTADKMLTFENIKASFVIAYINESTIGISARSLGEINVQIIMEELQGGGHFTNAATQLEGMSLDEVFVKLREVIEKHVLGDEIDESNFS